ncbi:hypothetical protein BU24DRAFT_469342 [Aaosphaeria arxii CBS 175.79]|uniref:DUF3533 domain-containing protein n=1 Tax=Aaosphaeria arxii CBS 175.79 TaxID=1450172 RepID=A0A6A5Y5M7_9PLEO|nr:uncharacterized protein BU24DRAFT_469342 [Aaosphaeria arxii CBS 175.79]KAF2020579.1 hypothetical protein BU24DRAFT_469342 [Aaosphaeria arxii CBS 175.79]
MLGATPETKSPVRQDESSHQSTELYSYTFFSPQGATLRKSLVPSLVLPIIYNIILLWVCLSLVLGSLVPNNDVSKLKVTALNLDDGAFGTGLIQGIQASLISPGPHLRWDIISNGNSVEQDENWSQNVIQDEKSWAVLQISANASSSLRAALVNGDSSYNPLSAVTLYFASARNQVTTLAVAIPAIMGLANQIIPGLAANSTASFLRSGLNDTALQTSLNCPQCLALPYAVMPVDLIPFYPSVAFGSINTGLIFLLVFTFNVFSILRATAELHGHLMTLQTHIVSRTISSLASYFILSLMYTLCLLAFSIPVTGKFTPAGSGFMVLWMLNWCTMGACGLVMESTFTIIGMKWAPYFLNIWLISNVCGSFTSMELMPDFYEYGYCMPFYHAIQAIRTILFGTKSHLGLNFGVLVVWVFVGWAGMVLGTMWRIRKGRRTGVHHVP